MAWTHIFDTHNSSTEQDMILFFFLLLLKGHSERSLATVIQYNKVVMPKSQSAGQGKIIAIRPPTRGFLVTRGQTRSTLALRMYLQCCGRAEIGETPQVSLRTISTPGKLMAVARRKAGMMKPFTATNPYQCIPDSGGIMLCVCVCRQCVYTVCV